MLQYVYDFQNLLPYCQGLKELRLLTRELYPRLLTQYFCRLLCLRKFNYYQTKLIYAAFSRQAYLQVHLCEILAILFFCKFFL